MNQSIRNIAAALAALAYLATASLSHADTLPGQQGLTCTYGPWKQSVLRSGATVITRTWVCQ
jgi:hypothetical protein